MNRQLTFITLVLFLTASAWASEPAVYTGLLSNTGGGRLRHSQLLRNGKTSQRLARIHHRAPGRNLAIRECGEPDALRSQSWTLLACLRRLLRLGGCPRLPRQRL